MYPYFDAHCDTLSRCAEEGWSLFENPGHIDLKRLKAYAPMGQAFAMFLDSARYQGELMFPKLIPLVERFQKAKAAEPALLRESFLTIEGAELLDCDLQNLETAKGWGVKWINLTWNHPNRVSGSCLTGEGLSDYGKTFVQRMGELSIAADVSHLSDKGFWDLCELDEVKILASHSNSRRLCSHPRNLTDEMFKAIVEKDGYVGLNFYTAFLGENPGIDTVIAHLEHFWELGGEDHVGLGGDFDGADVPEELNGVQKVQDLFETLARRNYADTVIEKFAYGNLKRFITALSDGN